MNTMETIETKNGKTVTRPVIMNVKEPLEVVQKLWYDFCDGNYTFMKVTPRTLDERIKEDENFNKVSEHNFH